MMTLSNYWLKFWLFFWAFQSSLLWAKEMGTPKMDTNETFFSNPPTWLKASRVEKVVRKIQSAMEWDIRKVTVKWYTSQEEFQKFHGYDATVLAVSQKPENTIHLGPRVTESNFDPIFGHELVHIILFQKYKDSVPKWLEEGLANHLSRHGNVDYAWLAKQPPQDIQSLVHPFMGSNTSSRYHYQASTAAIEMIASKCSLKDLLQLSVGTQLENYLSTFCNLDDVNASFQKWLKKKSS
jgi:hypothetical protein